MTLNEFKVHINVKFSKYFLFQPIEHNVHVLFLLTYRSESSAQDTLQNRFISEIDLIYMQRMVILQM